MEHLIDSIFDLYTASRWSPSILTSTATATLSTVDSNLTSAPNSTQTVHSICSRSALARAVYSPYDPIPATCQCLRWTPPRVASWRELDSFTDVLLVTNSVLSAARTLRRFLKQAVDAPALSARNKKLMKTFWYEFRGPLNRGHNRLEVIAHDLKVHWCIVLLFTFSVSSDLSDPVCKTATVGSLQWVLLHETPLLSRRGMLPLLAVDSRQHSRTEAREAVSKSRNRQNSQCYVKSRPDFRSVQ
ncbi:hypothetical protein B0H12DRAFT_1137368 [Mycena haematopus]|nr:hypothetical protein B0H12DRAFT_1137368 [Mycena haematopus]